MKARQGTASVNGTQLYFEIAGEGHPLVLIHGNTLDVRMWDDQIDTFAAKHQVIRYDMRGFGRSALPTHEAYAPADRTHVKQGGPRAVQSVGAGFSGRAELIGASFTQDEAG